jgi:hypothetical protein
MVADDRARQTLVGDHAVFDGVAEVDVSVHLKLSIVIAAYTFIG